MEDRRDRLRALGEFVRRRRKEVGLTGKDLAVRARIAQPTISRIETGQFLLLHGDQGRLRPCYWGAPEGGTGQSALPT
ncbi:helix-turn-helix domain-containing protein [Nonomuraea endophytica]|uniref:helix-turn-helix domain-containing protein n=1 Tax=Nonomuraea endophytica TaxID=714136 RepID=UPI0037C73323